jgi:hypothetical protein
LLGGVGKLPIHDPLQGAGLDLFKDTLLCQEIVKGRSDMGVLVFHI